LGGGILD